MKAVPFFICLFLSLISHAQKWVDTTYSIQIEQNISYGVATDFAGNERNLKLDIAYPLNDTPPECGRPLILVIHGGAFMAGSKEDGQVQALMKDFAKRGYVAVAPNYRLGMFTTEKNYACAFSSLFSIEWNCLNIQDTAEWYRAYFRAIQDVKGALRYMVQKRDSFKINTHNTFTTGFSAGGFIAYGVGFLDNDKERYSQCDSISNAKAPHILFENACIKKYQWDTSISRMNLTRPDLGSIHGSLHLSASTKYKIKGVGNLYGASFSDLLKETNEKPYPAIYGFHQPNDLIVPYKYQGVFTGYSNCMYSLCGRGIINRPFSMSSRVIYDDIQRLKSDGKPYPEMLLDTTKNFSDCNQQILDPSKGGHQLDNYSLRTTRLATFFANYIDTTDCIVSVNQFLQATYAIYPNPSSDYVTIESSENIVSITMRTILGQVLLVKQVNSKTEKISLNNIESGYYYLELDFGNSQYSHSQIVKN